MGFVVLMEIMGQVLGRCEFVYNDGMNTNIEPKGFIL